MKTAPSQLPRRCWTVITWLLGSSLIVITGGCAAKSTVAKQAPYPAPHVVGAAEIMQRDAVAARSRELMQTGKYKTSAEARSAAEKEFPPAVDPTESDQSAEYYRWKQQQATQAKFEDALDKMKRQP